MGACFRSAESGYADRTRAMMGVYEPEVPSSGGALGLPRKEPDDPRWAHSAREFFSYAKFQGVQKFLFPEPSGMVASSRSDFHYRSFWRTSSACSRLRAGR